MTSALSPLIDAEALLLRRTTKEIVLVDARTGADAKSRYSEAHLDGALFVDMNTQLANVPPNAANGGRHPLPDPQTFSIILQELGIAPGTHVVIYDDKKGSGAAARFWWMLRSAGHGAVQVLNGGLEAAIRAGFPVNDKEEKAISRGEYWINGWHLPLATMAETGAAAAADDHMVIDVRSPERFEGISEPFELVAGHIPGAVNIPFSSNLDEDGRYLSPDKLREKYGQAFAGIPTENIVLHCGSGVTACHTLLALDYAGLEIPSLYVGSWSEWSRNDRPIAVGKGG